MRLVAVGHQVDGLRHFLEFRIDIPNQFRDTDGGGLGLVGQRGNLPRHHREAPSRLPCSGGLDAGVQRQQAGLIGDAGDHLNDGVHLLRLYAQILHPAEHSVIGRYGLLHLFCHGVYIFLPVPNHPRRIVHPPVYGLRILLYPGDMMLYLLGADHLLLYGIRRLHAALGYFLHGTPDM